jgi:hypothetical protein
VLTLNPLWRASPTVIEYGGSHDTAKFIVIVFRERCLKYECSDHEPESTDGTSESNSAKSALWYSLRDRRLEDWRLVWTER